MDQSAYHFQLNPIVQDIDDSFSRYEDISSKRLELEFKYAFLKNCKNMERYKQIMLKSQKRPIIVNMLPDAKSFKINAACEKEMHDFARLNLKKLQEKATFEKQEKYLVQYRGSEEMKYVFDSSKKCWNTLEKDRLFHKQYDVISRKKMFRIDCSMKTQENIAPIAVKGQLSNAKKNRGFLRYKHANIFHYEYFDIQSSTIYQTVSQPQMNELIGFINATNGDITQKLRLKMELEQKRTGIRYELELKMTEKGLDYVRQCNENQRKEEVSKAFNALRDITDPLVLDEKLLVKLLEDLSLQQNERPVEKVEKEDVQKEEKKQEEKPVLKRQQEDEKQFVFIVKRP